MSGWNPSSLRYAGPLLVLLALVPALIFPEAAMSGWLAGFIFASSVVLGALMFVMLTRIIPGAWRTSVEPPALAICQMSPGLLLLLVPLLAGMPWIYGWAAGAPLSGFKAYYLWPPVFAGRLLLLVLAATWAALLLGRGFRRRLAIGGLIAFVLLDTVFATDLIQSLDPKFSSSGFGLYVLGLQALTAFAVMILVSRPSAETGGASTPLLGALLLTLLLLWAYFFFMQYFILWSGNLPPKAEWYLRRSGGGWLWIERLLAVLRLLPPFLLLFPPIRVSPAWLRGLAVATLAGSVVEIAWIVFPESSGSAWLALLCFLVGSLGVAVSAGMLTDIWRRAAMPAPGEGAR